jgi:multiple sugar transport system permease protein
MVKSRAALFFAWALLAPAILYVMIIVAWPLIETVRLSFTDASLRKVTNYVGWRNYTKIIDPHFFEIIVRTFT